MKALYVMPDLPWPLHSGQHVHAHHLMTALVESGHELQLLIARRNDEALLADWPLRRQVSVRHLPSELEAEAPIAWHLHPMQYLRRRWAHYWGWPDGSGAAVADAAAEFDADYVEAFGLDVLPLLVETAQWRPVLWMAGDDWCLHHLTLLRSTDTWRGRIKVLTDALRMAAYERSFGRSVGTAVAVSDADHRALRRIGGFRRVLLAPSGIDADYFQPTDAAPEPLTALFWGRLDFEPNIDAVCWFAREVWPRLHARHGQATWWIVGRNPDRRIIEATQQTPGIELIGEVDDLRPWIERAAVCVLPMRSGAGIKNKLLEAAAMARPILASPTAVRGLIYDDEVPWQIAASPHEWIKGVQRLWNDTQHAKRKGRLARKWVVAHHDWRINATQRETWLWWHRGLKVAPAPLTELGIAPVELHRRGLAA